MNKKINLKLMEKYFVKKLGFQSITGEDFYVDGTIEEELYLRLPEVGYIEIVKRQDEDDYDFKMQGDIRKGFRQYDKYVGFFVDKTYLMNNGFQSFVKEMDEEIKQLEKE